jgi:hypothetical protein
VLRGLTAAGDKVVGVASLATVSSADGSICTVSPLPRLGEGAYLVQGKSAGTCRITATLGARESVREVAIHAQ